jgi:ssDNA-binding replication factor A large subunit
MKIQELKPGMEDVDLIARIVELKEPRKVTTYNKIEHTIVEGTVEDDSGAASITVWDDIIQQLDGLVKGDSVKLSKCFITSFKRVIHINLGRGSRILKMT